MVVPRKIPPSSCTRVLDAGLWICAAIGILVFLIVLLLVDAREYISVRGALHARRSLHSGVEKYSGFGIMIEEEHAALNEEIREAKNFVADKEEELENLEEVKEKLSMLNQEQEEEAESSSEKYPEKKEEGTKTEAEKKAEDKKEKTAVLDKKLGLDKFCNTCKWADTSYSCEHRVKFLSNSHNIAMEVAKMDTMQNGHCIGSGSRKRLRGDGAVKNSAKTGYLYLRNGKN